MDEETKTEESKVVEETPKEEPKIDTTKESLDTLLEEMKIIKARLFAIQEDNDKKEKSNVKKQLHY